MKCYLAKPNEVEREWLVVDADGIVMGRLAAKIAAYLRGKHKATFSPGVDTGDFVVIVNADKVRITGNKMTDKLKYSHSGVPGGFKQVPFGVKFEKDPAETVRRVIKGMLPKNPLGRKMYRKLKVYAGAEHPHIAQGPRDVTAEVKK